MFFATIISVRRLYTPNRYRFASVNFSFVNESQTRVAHNVQPKAFNWFPYIEMYAVPFT